MDDDEYDVPSWSNFFQQEYDRHLEEIEAEERKLRIAMTEADQHAGIRARSLNGTTTSPTVKVRNLKRRIIEKLEHLTKLSKEMSPIILGLRLDEIELALLMHGQRRMAAEDWRRIADGKVYEGAKFFLDMLYKNHHIDSYALGSFSQAEVNSIARELRKIIEKRKR